MSLTLPRLVLGPQSEGRNHGILARSAGAELSGAAESALRDYHLRIGDYLADPAPIYALFDLPEGPAAACVTTRHGDVRGNRVWATSVVLLSTAHRRSLSPLLSAFAPLAENAPLPAIGVELPAWSPTPGPQSGTWPPGQLQDVAATLSPDAPLAVEVSAPQTVLGLLAGLIPLLKTWQRLRLSFVSAPAPLKPWTLVAYQAEAWDAAAALNRSFRLVRLGGGQTAEPGGGAAAGVWSQLLHALGDEGDLAESLYLAGDGVAGGESPAALVRERTVTGLNALSTDAARREALSRLISAAMSLKAAARSAAVAGLYDAFESLAGASDTPEAWVEDYLARLAPLTSAEPQAPLFIGRVALQSGALFRLPAARVAELAPLLVGHAADAVRSELLRRSDSPARDDWPQTDLILLQNALKAAENTPERDEIWRLSTRLARQVAVAAQPEVGVRAALTGFLGLCLRHGRDAEYAALLSASTLPGLVRIVGQDGLKSLLVGPIRMVREELELYPDQTPTRDLVIYALCLRRAGALVRAAA